MAPLRKCLHPVVLHASILTPVLSPAMWASSVQLCVVCRLARKCSLFLHLALCFDNSGLCSKLKPCVMVYSVYPSHNLECLQHVSLVPPFLRVKFPQFLQLFLVGPPFRPDTIDFLGIELPSSQNMRCLKGTVG